jgi:hypothetical protein
MRRRLAGGESTAKRLESGGGLTSRNSQPLNREKFLWDSRSSLISRVNDHWQQKGVIVSHIEGPLDSQPPLPPEIPFMSCFRLRGHERHKIVALTYPFADFLIPHVPAAQVAFVVPNLESKRWERISD